MVWWSKKIYTSSTTIFFYNHKNYLLVDNLKIVEIERCKKDIYDMKGQIQTAQTKMIDYSRLRYVAS